MVHLNTMDLQKTFRGQPQTFRQNRKQKKGEEQKMEIKIIFWKIRAQSCLSKGRRDCQRIAKGGRDQTNPSWANGNNNDNFNDGHLQANSFVRRRRARQRP